MLIVQVHVHVKAQFVEDFKKATIENASGSVKEEGINRFDVIQQEDDPTHFILVETFYSPEAAAKHKETAHYIKWSSTVAEMMSEPRNGIKYRNVFPDDAGW